MRQKNGIEFLAPLDSVSDYLSKWDPKNRVLDSNIENNEL